MSTSPTPAATRLLYGLPAVQRNGYWLVFSSDFSNLARIPEDRADLPETYHELIENGFMSPLSKKGPAEKVIHVTLIITKDCNLRCKYCFADAGDVGRKVMSVDIALAALRYAAKKAQGRKMSISFFGGEPTTEFRLIEQAVLEAEKISRENDLPRPEFSVTTNGVFNEKVHEFLVEHDFLVTLSADGPSEVQDFHRPAIHGGSSTPVEKTIKRFVESGHGFKLRATVTELSVHRMSDIVLWFSKFGVKNPEVHFEPVSISGRARSLDAKIGKPSVSDFVDNLKKAIAMGTDVGAGVTNSSYMNLVNSPAEFCDGDVSHRFAVTVEGSITRCVEVQDSYHPASEFLILGRYDEKTKNFIIKDEGARSCGGGQAITFRSGKGDDCSTCFANRVCGGGCPVRNFHTTGQPLTVDPYRCAVTKEMVPHIYTMIDEASE